MLQLALCVIHSVIFDCDWREGVVVRHGEIDDQANPGQRSATDPSVWAAVVLRPESKAPI